jgi:hypothetical protein
LTTKCEGVISMVISVSVELASLSVNNGKIHLKEKVSNIFIRVQDIYIQDDHILLLNEKVNVNKTT